MFADHAKADPSGKTKPTVLPPGAASPYRDRSVEENLKLFEQMRLGLWDEGTVRRRRRRRRRKGRKGRSCPAPLCLRHRHGPPQYRSSAGRGAKARPLS